MLNVSFACLLVELAARVESRLASSVGCRAGELRAVSGRESAETGAWRAARESSARAVRPSGGCPPRSNYSTICTTTEPVNHISRVRYCFLRFFKAKEIRQL